MIEQSMKIFRAAAAAGSFTGAAALLGMTQSNVTQQVAKLEWELKTPLFFRNGRKVELTPAGAVLKEECERLFAAEADILRKLRCAESRKAAFTLGGTVTAGSFLLPGLAAGFSRERSRYALFLKIGPQEELQNRLEAGELELVLTEEPFDREHFLFEPYCKDRLVPVFAPGFRRQKRFSLAEYLKNGNPLVLDEYGSAVHRAFLRFLKEHGIPEPAPETLHEVASLDAVKLLVQSGPGIAVLSELAVENELKAGVLQAGSFTEGEILREAAFIYLPGGNQKFIGEFIRFSRARRGRSLLK
ncbi:MAG: LysR family transcriptional regulator [Lentisphaeria bacterium]|nr:LysR family transcriptional regulator [Lentisphaeria bacterium]